MSRCEWDPKHNRAARVLGRHRSDDVIVEGCPNEATICVGANGQWHLCESCAELPEFRRFRIRKPLRGRS